MTARQFDDWSRHSVRSFAAQQVAAGVQSAVEATAYADEQIRALLPHGLDTPLHHVWHVVAADEVVGAVWVRVRALSTEVEAYLFDIEIVPGARGRGFGRAAMLAAEAAARDLGAGVLRLNAFGHNVPAIRLYESLGFRVARVAMTKRLAPDGPVDSGTGPHLRLRDMTAEEYVAFRPRHQSESAASLARSGTLPPAEAARTAADDLGSLLPRGRLSPGNVLWTAYHDEQAIGIAWLHLQRRSDGIHATAHRLQVREDLRGQGYGRALVAEVERQCRARDVRSVGLTVFGFETAARRLYERAGFEVTALSMAKAL